MLGWWYGAGWRWVILKASKRLDAVQRSFSVGTLFRTLLSPWKQIIGTSVKDQSLDNKFRAMLDSLVSRFVGFMVRSFTLIAAFVSLTLVLLLGLLSIVIWPFIPVSIIAVILLFVGVF